MATSSTNDSSVSTSLATSLPAKANYDFPDISDYLKSELAIALDGLCYEAYRQSVTLRPIRIRNCNAADSNRGKSFSEAYCDVEMESNKAFLLGDIFRHGLDMLIEFIENKTIPESKEKQIVLSKLLSFIKSIDEGSGLPVDDPEQLSETDLSLLLANHLFGKLATTNRYLIKKSRADKCKNGCPCDQRNCELNGTFGDTSFGNTQVWHGSIDILINNDIILESVDEDKTGNSGGKSAETKAATEILSKNGQIIAETIVFSFLQRQTHPEWSSFLTPCVAVGGLNILVMFYDCEHDVLLESSMIPLFETTETSEETPRRINMAAILVSWLIVNYKYFCSGLTKDMKVTYKAEFFSQMRDKVDIYEKKMSFGNVGTSDCSRLKSRKRERVVRNEYLYEKHSKLSKMMFERNHWSWSDIYE